MINTEQAPTLEVSEEMKETSFSVGDLAIIFGILRSKMYSHPPSAICRELGSNARDANIENKKPDEPIVITLPNAIDPTLRIKDSGIGISPDRADSVYVRYGASTKRNTNEQVGYFGTGSKVAFSYSECFNVETIHEGVRYCYSAIIDPSKVGKLLTLSEEPTDEPSGTTVSVPIKPADFRTFIDAVEQTTRHFNPRPIIKGGQVAYKEANTVLEGANWKIATSAGYNREVKLIIAGIEYPLDYTQLPYYHEIKLFNSIQGDVVLMFNTGE